MKVFKIIILTFKYVITSNLIHYDTKGLKVTGLQKRKMLWENKKIKYTVVQQLVTKNYIQKNTTIWKPFLLYILSIWSHLVERQLQEHVFSKSGCIPHSTCTVRLLIPSYQGNESVSSPHESGWTFITAYSKRVRLHDFGDKIIKGDTEVGPI